MIDDLSQRGGLRAADSAGDELAVEVPNRQTVSLDVQLGMILDSSASRAGRCRRSDVREPDMR